MPKSLWVVPLLVSAAIGLFARPAKADQIDEINFTVTVSSGVQSGDVFTGSYTYDATTLASTGTSHLLSFAFTDPAWSGNTLSSSFLTQANYALNPFTFNDQLNVFFAPGTGTNDAFRIFGTSFSYGTTIVDGTSFSLSGAGSATYSAPSTVPEIDPRNATSALALLLGAVLVVRGRRRKMTQPESGCERT